MNYSKEEWLDIFIKNKVLEKLKLGISYKALAVDLKENGYPCTDESIRKAVNRYYNKSKEQKLYYLDHQEEVIKYMNSIDVEATTDEISSKRYYSCFETAFWERENTEKVCIEVDKEIFEEYKSLSQEFGCDFEEEYMIMTLLKHLDEIRAVDKRRDFAIRAMSEDKNNWYPKEEMDVIYQKEKEGYSLLNLYYASCDYTYRNMSKEEFEKVFKKENESRSK